MYLVDWYLRVGEPALVHRRERGSSPFLPTRLTPTHEGASELVVQRHNHDILASWKLVSHAPELIQLDLQANKLINRSPVRRTT